MRLFLLWQPKSSHARDSVARVRDTRLVAEQLARLFSQLFDPAPKLETRSAAAAHLAWLELPVAGFRAPFFEQSGGRWALAPEYPLNARRLLRERGRLPADGLALLALAREWEAEHADYVRELIPPASLIWSNGDAIQAANDGLGQAPLFEYEDDDCWALTNRVMALKALGVTLRPVLGDWAVRFTTNWFPGFTTGFEGVRYVPGGTRFVLGRAGVERRREDPLGDWVGSPANPRRSRAQLLELGHRGLMNVVRDAMELWERPSVGLSGGWDSRAVASCLRVLGCDMELRVRGRETNVDVLVSAQLARLAGLPHRIKTQGGLPPDTAEGCRVSVARALLWQGGNYATKKHKNFLAKAKKTKLSGGVVNVMGQHAGIGKGDFIRDTDAVNLAPERYEDALLDSLMQGAPFPLRPEVEAHVRAQLRASYRVALDYGLAGLEPLAFFYLHEFTRRWGAATIASQTGLVVAPFLCPDVIRACYGLDPRELASKPLHRHVTATNAPDWASYPYADEITDEDVAAGRIPPVALPPHQKRKQKALSDDQARWRNVRHHRKYHYKYYWKDVAQPLLQEALEADGLASKIFDVSALRGSWLGAHGGADCVVIAHLLPNVLDGSLP